MKVAALRGSAAFQRPRVVGRRQAGQILVVVACAMIALMGMAGYVIDVGALQVNRRHAQRAADAAAQAGAMELYGAIINNDSAGTNNARAAALQYAGMNGSDANNVAVEIPPSYQSNSRFAGSNGFIRVVVTRPVNTTFMRLFSPTRTVNVCASATAGVSSRPLPVPVLMLDPKKKNALKISKHSDVSLLNGYLYVNSKNKKAVQIDPSASLTANGLHVVGNINKAQNFYKHFGDTMPVYTGVDPMADPLAALPQPDLSQYSTSSDNQGSPSDKSQPLEIKSGSRTLHPGIYYGGIKISGGNVTLQTGTYIMADGGLTISGKDTVVHGDGILIFNTANPNVNKPDYDAINIKGDATVSLSPPSVEQDPLYHGILIFNDRANKHQIKIRGTVDFTSDTSDTDADEDPLGGASTLNGLIYAPRSMVSIGKHSTLSGLAVIAWRLGVMGHASLGFNDLQQTPTAPLPAMVE